MSQGDLSRMMTKVCCLKTGRTLDFQGGGVEHVLVIEIEHSATPQDVGDSLCGVVRQILHKMLSHSLQTRTVTSLSKFTVPASYCLVDCMHSLGNAACSTLHAVCSVSPQLFLVMEIKEHMHLKMKSMDLE